MSKKIAAIVLFNLIAFYSAGQKEIDVLHYKFELELSDQSDSIKGIATITVKVPPGIDTVYFDLYGRRENGRGMIASVRTEEQGDTVSTLQYIDRLLVRFKPSKSNVKTFIIHYKGIPEDGLIISKNRYGDRTFFSDNWPNRAHHWIPCHDDPADKASVEFIVTAPDHYKVVSNGILKEEKELRGKKKRTHWEEEIPLPTKIMVIGVARFEVETSGKVENIPVSSWVFPQNKKEGFYDYSQATSILEFFIKYIGPFPYKKLANVQSKTIFGGMENASAIFYAESAISGKQREERLIAHEVAHQWFGDMVTEKNFAHLWLSEGFADYFSNIFIESKYGTDSLNYEMRKDRQIVVQYARESERPVVDSTSQLMELLNANSYQKGGWVLHMLRRQLGDSIFRECIRAYYKIYAGANTETLDFQRICELVSGKDLGTFFLQWLFKGGHPKLKVDWEYSGNDRALSLSVRQLNSNPFVFPLTIGIYYESGKYHEKTFEINEPDIQTTINVAEKVKRIVLDPGTSLLFEGTVSQVK